MRLIEVINSLPGLLLILAVLAIVKEPSIYYVMIVIGLISWTSIARYIRAEMLRVRQMDYILAGKALGYGPMRLLLRHALPNGIRPVLIAISFGMAGAILLEAFLSFLGIGLPADAVTWGSLIRKIQSNALTGAWWIALFPGLAIFFTVTIFNLIGEGLTEAMNE
jgi:peptide/nickel transport system permease protein